MEPFFFLAFLSSVLPIALLVLIVVAVLSGRHEPDPTRERPAAIYLAAACFVAIFTLLASVAVVVVSLLGLTSDSDSGSFRSASASRSVITRNPSATLEYAPPGDGSSAGSRSFGLQSPPEKIGQGEVPFEEDGQFDEEEGQFDEEDQSDEENQLREEVFSSSFGDDAEDNRDIASAVRAGIVALLALGIFVFHDPRLSRLVAASRGPAARVYAKYLYLLCFIAIVVFLGAAAMSLFSVFAALAPGVAGSDSRSEALRDLASAGVVALGAALIFLRHWRRADALAAATPVVEEVVVVERPVDEPPTPRGRIRRPTPPPTEE